MAKLTEEVKTFIVQELACFERPSDVAESVRNHFKVEIGRNRVQEYDASGYRRNRMAKKWRKLFDSTREAFLNDASTIPVANKSVRIRYLERLYEKAARMGNAGLAARLLEQVAKETGGSYTNKREHSGPGGAPMSARLEVEFVDGGGADEKK